MFIIEDGVLFCAAGSTEQEIVDSWNHYFPLNFYWISEFYEGDYYFDLIEPVNSYKRILEIIKILNYDIEDCNIRIKYFK